MAITFVSVGDISVEESDYSCNVPYPGSLQDGDFLVAFIFDLDDDQISSPPTGWAMAGYTVEGAKAGAIIMYGYSDGTESGTLTFTTDNNGGAAVQGMMAAFRGVLESNPFDDSNWWYNSRTLAPYVPELTASEDGCLMVAAACSPDFGTGSYGAGGFDFVLQDGSNYHRRAFYSIRPSAGTKVEESFATLSKNYTWGSTGAVFKPATPVVWTGFPVKAYIEGSWQTKPLKAYTGASWVTKPLKVN